MPQKANPVLSVLIRRAALAAPGLAAQLHLAAAAAVDERPDGAWHTEWATLAPLGRRTLTAASQTTELVAGLHVDTGRMRPAGADGGVGPARRAAQPDRLAGRGPTPPTSTPLTTSAAPTRSIDALLTRARPQKDAHE